MQTLIKTLLLVLLVWQTPAYGQQDFTAAMKDRPFECPDIAYKSSIIFKQFMERHQYDSAHSILDYWESKCGRREPVFRAQIALALAEDRSVDSFISDESIYLLINYKYRAEIIRNRNFSLYDYNKPYYGFVPIGQEFDSFTKVFFVSVLPLQKQHTTRYLLSDFYGNNSDSLFAIVQDSQYAGTKLARQYFSLLDEYRYRQETHIAALAGIWIPTGEIAWLGIHPELGFQVGVKYRRFNIDGTIVFKFIRAADSYAATRVHSDRSVVITDKFFGGYIGLDAGYDLLRKKGNELQLLCGFGGDGFNAINEDASRGLKEESTWTFNLNFGLGYRYYTNNHMYIGLRAKYNIVDYASNGVVNLTGNPITITFAVGGLFNKTKDYELKNLMYKQQR